MPLIGLLVLSFFALLWLLAKRIQRALRPAPPHWYLTLVIFIGLVGASHLDVPIGYFTQYRPLVRKIGQGAVYRQVTADGYLDASGMTTRSSMGRSPFFTLLNPNFPYAYIELDAGHASRFAGSSPRRGFVVFRRAAAGSPACVAPRAPTNARERQLMANLLPDQCVTATVSEEPISRYEIVERATGKANPQSVFAVMGTPTLIIDRLTGETIAECTSLSYTPLVSQLIFAQFVHWAHNPSCKSGGLGDFVFSAVKPARR